MTAVTSGRRKIRRPAVLAAAVLVLSMLYIAPASADAVCATPADGEVTLTVSGDTDVTMAADGQSVVLSTACSISVVAGATDAAEIIKLVGSGTVTFVLSDHDFEMTDGFELWFQLDMTAGGTDSVIVEGTDDDDRVLVGSEGLNLDGQNEVEVSQLDEPLTDFTDAGVESVSIYGMDGSDILNAGGLLSGDPFPQAITINGFDADPSDDEATQDEGDQIEGGAANDTLNGGPGNDTLDGGEGDDTMMGGDGNDSFDAESDPEGGDLMDGEDGKDTADYGSRTQDLFLSVAAVGALPGDDGQGVGCDPDTFVQATCEGDSLVNLEKVFGGEGDDLIDAKTTEADTPVTLRGDEGDDTLIGGFGNDTLVGEDGVDTIHGEGIGAPDPAFCVDSDDKKRCNDKIDGGDGDDFEFGELGNDKFDQRKSGNGDDTIDGGDQHNNGSDIVKYNGRSRGVTVDFAGGNSGEAGEADVLTGLEKASGGRGNDTMNGSAQDDIFLGQGGEDELNGGDGKDTLKGGGDNDELNGGDANDKLYGNAGRDKLNGDGGTDFGHGGTGRDTCTSIEKEKSC